MESVPDPLDIAELEPDNYVQSSLKFIEDPFCQISKFHQRTIPNLRVSFAHIVL